jgi:carbamoyl-phosphate synthase large subunit
VGTGARVDGYEIRSAAIARGIPCITTMTGGMAAARAIAAGRRAEPEVLSLQEIHGLREIGSHPPEAKPTEVV